MRFLQDTDYSVQLRAETSRLIDTSIDNTKLLGAELMAISQIKNYICGSYDVNLVFAPQAVGDPDTRSAFIVMIAIDIAIYHLYSKEPSTKIPEERKLRYADALEWLKSIQNGANADLPKLKNSEGLDDCEIRLWSDYKRENNRY